MVCGNHFHNAIPQSLTQCFHVFLCAEWRIHLVIGIRFFHIVCGQRKVMRTHFCRHPDTFFLCHFYHEHGILCGTMTQMKLCPGIFCQNNISCNNHILHGIGNSRKSQFFCFCIGIHDTSAYHMDIFAMGKYRNAQTRCLKHTVPIQSGIHDRFSVLADCRTSCLNHSFNIRKFFSLLSLCHRTNLQDMNTAPEFCFVVHIIDNIRIVCYRLCIRHGQHCRISTMRSGLHPGINILFLFKSRIAEMYMHINKSRHHITSVRIDHTFGFFFRKFFSNLFYLLIFDQDICHLIHLCCRIDDMSPFD